MRTVGILATIALSVGGAFWIGNHFFPINVMGTDFWIGAGLVVVGLVAALVALVIANEEDMRR